MHILEKNPIMFFIVMDINHYYSIITSQIQIYLLSLQYLIKYLINIYHIFNIY